MYDDQYTVDTRADATADAWIKDHGGWNDDVLSARQLLERRKREAVMEDTLPDRREEPPVYLTDIFADGIRGMTVPDAEKLKKHLAGGPLEATEVQSRMGLSDRKFKAARVEAGVKWRRIGFGPGGRIVLELP
jgi:hypothetical protein